MKATGIIRRVDDLGRVVIPKDIRRVVRIREGDPLEIFVEDGGVLFKPYRAIDNYKAAFEMACRLLQWSGVKHYTVYDRHAKVANYNVEKPPDYPEPDHHREDAHRPECDLRAGRAGNRHRHRCIQRHHEPVPGE